MTSRSLLLIDNNNDYTELVKLFLEQSTEWQIITALDGEEGIKKALLEQPDLILVDLAMPDIDGVAVYKILKSDLSTCYIPTVFITAMVGVEKMICSEANADVEIITKPMDLTVLKDCISDLYARYLSFS